MKLIDLHKKWCEKKRIPNRRGLCGVLRGKYKMLLKKFTPTKKERVDLFLQGLASSYWGSGVGACDLKNKCGGYTSLRQTIVLLICAMNNEL